MASSQNANVYFLALLGGISYNLNQTSAGQRYADFLVTAQSAEGSMTQSSSFFSQYDDIFNSILESTAMAAIVWEHDYERYGA
jgi:hypothetical protein